MKSCPTCNNSYDDATVFCPVDGSSLLTANKTGDLIGSVIANRYLVTGRIGEGGMGSVYLAQHVRLPQKVAIKVLHTSLSNAADMIARFNREALNASSISNEHVARVYDFGETSGQLYLAMEYVEGETLGALLNRTETGVLGFDRVGRIASQIADGLDAAHKLGIVHRDLKPDNILVSSDTDGSERLKIVDFGIAKVGKVQAQSVTQTGMAIGTAEFMSPEQIVGEEVDQRTDVYALGLVTCLLLTGKLPFQGESKQAAMLMRLTRDPATLQELRPDIEWPAALQAALSKALARNVEQRYASAGEFAIALSGVLGVGEAAAIARINTPPSWINTPPSWINSPPAWINTPAAGVQPTAVAVPVGRPSRRSLWIVGGVLAAAAGTALLAVLLNWNGAGSGNANGNANLGGNPGAGSASGNNDVGVQAPPPALAPAETAKVQTPVKDASTKAVKGTDIQTRKTNADSQQVVKTAGANPPAGGRDSIPRQSAEVQQLMEQIDFNTDMLRASITPEDARQGLLDIAKVLPLLRTRSDSGHVEMQRIEAHILLNQNAQACIYIKALLPKVERSDRGALENYNERLCR